MYIFSDLLIVGVGDHGKNANLEAINYVKGLNIPVQVLPTVSVKTSLPVTTINVAIFTGGKFRGHVTKMLWVVAIFVI